MRSLAARFTASSSPHFLRTQMHRLTSSSTSGQDGRPILFYARRATPAPTKPKSAKPKLEAKRGDVLALIDGLNDLGFTAATAAEVQRVTDELYPHGTAGLDRGEVLRAVFLHLKRQNSADNVQ